MFANFARYLENPRYIRFDNKPLFAIFAPERHPLMKEYAEIWREEAHKRGWPGIWLAGVEAFEGRNPYELGLDGMIEFAPNWIKKAQVTPAGVTPRRLDYAEIVRFMLAKDVPQWPCLRCAFPEWDNTPRRGADGVAITGASPDLFRVHLQCLKEYTETYLPESERYIFINAWNVWGETCYLEPDRDRGFEYLKIVREIMGAN